MVIVAKYAERTIRHAVESLLRQTIKPREIVVVVDASADPTVEAVQDLPVRIILNEGAGLGAARKTGVDASTGDAIAFIDADCIADERWIGRLVEAFSESNVMVQAGSVVGVKSSSEISTTSLQRPLSSRNTNFLKFAPTMNFAFRKDLVNIVGNFDPWFKGGGEDLDFCIRLKKAGYGVYYNQDAKVFHLAHRISSRRAWRDGKSRAQALIKHGGTMLGDASIVFFHAMSLLSSLTLLVTGYPKLAFLLLTPSLMHRLYRAVIGVKRGNTVLASLSNSFAAYVSHISFTISFIISLPGLAIKRDTRARVNERTHQLSRTLVLRRMFADILKLKLLYKLPSIYIPRTLAKLLNKLSESAPRLIRRLFYPLIVGTHMATFIITDSLGEKEVVEAFTPLLGQTVVDIGAHIGTYTILAGNCVSKAGKVIAIEAHPHNYKILSKNLMFNGLRNVVPVNVAVSNREGRVKLYLGIYDTTHSTVHNNTRAQTFLSEKYLVVPCVTLDGLLEKLGVRKVDWVKVDVEGAELNVLKGMSTLLRSNHQLNLIMELHYNNAKTISYLESFGFNVKVLAVHEDGRQHIYAGRKFTP